MAGSHMTFTLDGNDQLSRVLRRAGDAADTLSRRLAKVGAVGASGPIGAAAVAGAGAMTAAFASAGAAVTAFSAAAGPQLGKVTEASELYTKAQEAAAEGGKKAADAQKAYTDALAKMPPATRQTATAFIGLKNDYNKWSDAMSSHTMPVFTKAIGVLRDILPKLSPLVKTASAAFSDFFDHMGRGVDNGGFDRFVGRLNDAAKKTLPSLLASFRNVFVGIGGIINAFLPSSVAFSGGMERMTASFARWGQGLKDSAGFARFMDTARTGTDTLGALAVAFGRVLVSMGPILGTTVTLANGFARFLNSLPPETLQFIATSLVTIKVATLAWAGAQMVLNGALAANPIGAVVTAIVLVGAALVTAWQRSQRFREVTTSAFSLLGQAVLLWANLVLSTLKVVFVDGLGTAVGTGLRLAEKAFGWVPGLGGKIKAARRGFDDFRDGANGAFDTAIDKTRQWQSALERLPSEVRLKGDISDLEQKIAAAKEQLGDANLPKAKRAKLTADIADWNAKLIDAKVRLERTPARKVARLTGDIADWHGKIAAAERQLKTAKGSKKAQLTANIADWQSKVSAAERQLKNMDDRRTAYLGANITDLVGGVNSAQRHVNSLRGRIVNVGIHTVYSYEGHRGPGGFPKYASGGLVRGFPDGGLVRGPGTETSDSILARVSNNEFVVRARSVAKYGLRFMTALNEGRLGTAMQMAGGRGGGAPTVQAGVDIARGLIVGMTSQAGALQVAAARTSRAALTGVRTEMQIASPSKRTRALGAAIGQGLITGMTGTKDKIASTAKSMLSVFSTHVDKKWAATLGATWLKPRTAYLTTLASQRDALAAKIKEAKEFASETTATAKGTATLGNLGMGEGEVTAGGIKAGLASKLAQVRQFARFVDILAKRGLHKGVLRQILNMGPEAGYAYANALAGADVNTFKSINSLQSQVDSSSVDLGRLGADRLYDAGKEAGRGFLKGLEGQQKALQNLMLGMARAMQSALRRALGIRSPSTVMAALGRYSTQGLAAGLVQAAPEVDDAMGALAGRVAAGVGPVPAAALPAPRAAGGGQGPVIHIHVDGTVMDPGAVARQIQRTLLGLKRDQGGALLGLA
ncbi:phage tail tape measure protein [Streptomyces youssoufiensis]